LPVGWFSCELLPAASQVYQFAGYGSPAGKKEIFPDEEHF